MLWLIFGFNLRIFAKEIDPNEQISLSETTLDFRCVETTPQVSEGLHKESTDNNLPVRPECGKDSNGRTGQLFGPILKYSPEYGIDILDIRRGLEGKISVDLSTTVQSKHMWHGFSLYGSHGVVMPAVGVTLGDTGFSGKYIRAYPTGSGLEKSEQAIYAAFYTGAFLKDTPYVTNFTANYFYYGMPEIGGAKSDMQEVGVSFSWPKLLGNSGLMPNYYFGRLWPTRSQSNVEGCEGFIHTFGLVYDLNTPNFWAVGKGQTFRLSSDITYNDGFGPGADHAWSHVVFGVSTSLGNGKFTITPFVNYQISMDASVDKQNELWCGVNATYRF
jgi:hypothetical protein